MITDDKKREVAQKLRSLDMSDIEVDGCIIDSPKYVGLLLMRMLDAACDYRDGLHHFPGFFSAQAVVELFADLIDCGECENAYDGSVQDSCDNGFECSVCGCKVEDKEHYHVSGTWNYCPGCGRKVMNHGV